MAIKSHMEQLARPVALSQKISRPRPPARVASRKRTRRPAGERSGPEPFDGSELSTRCRDDIIGAEPIMIGYSVRC
ncbi:hypothetical protein E2562_008345 [Oryza meyeriana var. granulata]|uniref:Uncharacterized protein n=1 Tax=Oryza meyeriana var. granulata TaxID=110450 RepID=A0A6G1EFZ2_9ORYZ|nr:hypothetical protein E2562_008345 [Oryza meyeriana var. granulata]